MRRNRIAYTPPTGRVDRPVHLAVTPTADGPAVDAGDAGDACPRAARDTWSGEVDAVRQHVPAEVLACLVLGVVLAAVLLLWGRK